MDFLKNLGKSLIKFSDIESMNKQLMALVKIESIKKKIHESF